MISLKGHPEDAGSFITEDGDRVVVLEYNAYLSLLELIYKAQDLMAQPQKNMRDKFDEAVQKVIDDNELPEEIMDGKVL